jgi:transcription elongation factor Elf1
MTTHTELPADPFHADPCTICDTDRTEDAKGLKRCPRCDRSACPSCHFPDETGTAAICVRCGTTFVAHVRQPSANVNDPQV